MRRTPSLPLFWFQMIPVTLNQSFIYRLHRSPFPLLSDSHSFLSRPFSVSVYLAGKIRKIAAAARAKPKMQSISLSHLLTCPSFSTKPTHLLSIDSSLFSKPIPHLSLSSSSHHFNPLRLSLNHQKLMGNWRRLRRSGIVCYSSSSILSPGYLHWTAAVSAAILMLMKGAPINKAYVVPLFALQAPPSIISWMKGQYGAWSAFLALLIRLFFFLPGELELPFITLVMVIVAPTQALNLRGTQGGTIISLVIAAYLAFQHFSGAGSLRKAFDRNSIVASLAIICLTIVQILLLI